MSQYKLKETEKIRKMWNNRAATYDQWYETFEGAVENHVDLELLKRYLPESKTIRILDAAGGTGRITLPLAKMRYSLTLCDISTGMLAVAKKKMIAEGVAEKVTILQCDVRNLPFVNESFDFVLCWDGTFEGTKELIRVTRKGGSISVFLVNKMAAAVSTFYRDPDSALAFIDSAQSFLKNEDGKRRAMSTEEGRALFEAEGVRVVDSYAVYGWLDVLRIPEKVLRAPHWNEEFFEQTSEMALKLSQEPSVKGMSKHLVVYGEKM